MMFDWLRRRGELRHIGQQLYERIVAQARSAAFYRDHGVPDTMEGRFDMIVLHLFLVRERLKREGAAGQRLGQIVLEHLIADMDDALRQIGIGDMGVPHRVKKAAAAFGERAKAYSAALMPASNPSTRGGGTDDRLETALLTHVYQCQTTNDTARHVTHVDRLAAYVRAAADALDRQTSDALLAGDIAFPEIPSMPGVPKTEAGGAT